MTSDPTALIDSQALGTDLANALIHTIVEAHHVITNETKPPTDQLHNALENVCEIATALRALTRTTQAWDIYLDSGIQHIQDTP